MTLDRTTQAIKISLAGHFFTHGELRAEEVARNIMQALMEPVPDPGAVIAEMLYSRREHVKYIVDAIGTAKRAWMLGVEPTVEGRMAILRESGMTEINAQWVLRKLELAA